MRSPLKTQTKQTTRNSNLYGSPNNAAPSSSNQVGRSVRPPSVLFSSDDEAAQTVPYRGAPEESQVDAYTKYMVAEVGRSQGSFKSATARKESAAKSNQLKGILKRSTPQNLDRP